MIGQAERHPASSRFDERGEKRAIDAPQFDRLGAVNALAGETAQELRRVLVHVDRDAGRGLRGPVQARRIRRSDLDPGTEPAGEVADGNRRLVGIGQPGAKTRCRRANSIA